MSVLMDLNYTRDTTSGQEGLDLLTRIQAVDSMVPVVVMTAWGSVELAVETMRRGARDFIQKPWDNARLMTIVRTQVELSKALRRGQRLEAENRLLRHENRPTMIARVACHAAGSATDLPGGSVGCERADYRRARHRKRSGRANAACDFDPLQSKPMVTVNAGGLAEGIFESELFGHVKGAFTDAKVDRVGRFELADGGTLFLDEIANVPMNLQAKLLRVLETGRWSAWGPRRRGSVDVRVISATNADLAEEVAAGRFRAGPAVPAEHHRDPSAAAAGAPGRHSAAGVAFPGHSCARYRKRSQGFDKRRMQALLENPWQGNVRELNHVVERAVLMAQDNLVTRGRPGFARPARRLRRAG